MLAEIEIVKISIFFASTTIKSRLTLQTPRISPSELPWAIFITHSCRSISKNAGATYQRAMIVILHDCLEDYVDDIVVKAKVECHHTTRLRKVFTKCKQCNLRMNPLKCAFDVSLGIFFGFTIHRKEIDLDPTNAKAIHPRQGTSHNL